MKKIRQGQTRWRISFYPAGELRDDCAVAHIFACYATKVTRDTVHFDAAQFPYMCHHNLWRKFYPTYRQALKEAQRMVESRGAA